MQQWACPTCGYERESFSLPHHKHDGDWVEFVPVVPAPVAADPVVPAKRGRPRKQPEE